MPDYTYHPDLARYAHMKSTLSPWFVRLSHGPMKLLYAAQQSGGGVRVSRLSVPAVRWELPPYASLCSGGLRGRDAVRVLSPRRRVRVQRSAAPFRSSRRACPRAWRARRAAGLPARAAAHVPRRARGRFDRLPLALGKRRRPSHRSGADRRRGRQRGRESCRGALSYGEGAAPPDAVRADAALSGAGRAHGDGELPAVHGHAHVQQLPIWRSTLPCTRPIRPPRPREWLSPAESASLQGLPGAYIETAEFDCLRDEGAQYAAHLAREGVPCEYHPIKNAMHGYDIAVNSEFLRPVMAYRIEFLRKVFTGR